MCRYCDLWRSLAYFRQHVLDGHRRRLIDDDATAGQCVGTQPERSSSVMCREITNVYLTDFAGRKTVGGDGWSGGCSNFGSVTEASTPGHTRQGQESSHLLK